MCSVITTCVSRPRQATLQRDTTDTATTVGCVVWRKARLRCHWMDDGQLRCHRASPVPGLETNEPVVSGSRLCPGTYSLLDSRHETHLLILHTSPALGFQASDWTIFSPYLSPSQSVNFISKCKTERFTSSQLFPILDPRSVVNSDGWKNWVAEMRCQEKYLGDSYVCCPSISLTTVFPLEQSCSHYLINYQSYSYKSCPFTWFETLQ